MKSFCLYVFFSVAFACGCTTNKDNTSLHNQSPITVVKDSGNKFTNKDLRDSKYSILLKYCGVPIACDELTIDMNGQVTVNFTCNVHTNGLIENTSVTIERRSAEFNVDDNILNALRDLLIANNIQGWHKEYHRDISDGYQIYLEVTIGSGEKKSCFLNNCLPSEQEAIVQFIRNKIIKTNQSFIAESITIKGGDE